MDSRAEKEIVTAVIIVEKELSVDDPHGTAGPRSRVAGLPLLQRQLLWLRQKGITQVHLISDRILLERITDAVSKWQRQIQIPAISCHEKKQQLNNTVARPYFLIDGQNVYHPALITDTHGLSGAFAFTDKSGQILGLGVLNDSMKPSMESLWNCTKIPLPANRFVQRAVTESEIKRAEKLIFDASRKETDGWFSCHLNRPISMLISKRLVRFPIHPHWITIFTLLVGLLAGFISAIGTHVCFAAGGVLFQLSSILDGIDGEIARAKLQTSYLGEWLDMLCDNLANAVYISGVSIGLFRMHASYTWLVAGNLGVMVYVCVLVLLMAKLVVNKSPVSMLVFQDKFKEPYFRNKPFLRFGIRLQPLIKRDFLGYAFMLAALINHAEIIVAGWLTGLLITSVTIWYLVKQPTARALFWDF